MTNLLKGFAILLLLQFVGETIVRGADLTMPGNVVGMVLLLLLLLKGIIPVEAVEEAADLLLSHLALFFVPAGVGVMVYFDLIADQWLPISVATVLSSFVVMAVTGWVTQKMEQGEATDAE